MIQSMSQKRAKHSSSIMAYNHYIGHRNRPDCNPIENVWSLMKLKINKRPPTSINNFVFRIKKQWKNLPIEFAEKLVDSMKKRVPLLIERKGDYINY